MSNISDFNIAVMPGDGIGEEITEPCLRLLERASARVGGLAFRFEIEQINAIEFYTATGYFVARAAGDHVGECALTRSVGTHDGVYFTFAYFQVQTF